MQEVITGYEPLIAEADRLLASFTAMQIAADAMLAQMQEAGNAG